MASDFIHTDVDINNNRAFNFEFEHTPYTAPQGDTVMWKNDLLFVWAHDSVSQLCMCVDVLIRREMLYDT